MAYVATSWAYRELISSTKLQQMSDNDAYLKATADAMNIAANTGKTGNPPAGAIILSKSGFQNITAGAGGALPPVTFTTAFPLGCIGVWMQTIAGGAQNPVVNGGVLTATGFTGIIPTVASGTAVQYCWFAQGW